MAGKFLVLWASSLRQSWPAYLLILLLFTLGIAAGLFGFQNLQADKVQELRIYLDQFLVGAAGIEVDAIKALQDVLYRDIVVILAIYLLGLTVIGIPVILGIIFTRGFVLGYTLGFLAGDKSMRGVVLVCAAVLPQNLIFIPALLLVGVAALSFAVLLARRFNNSKIAVWPSFTGYSGLIIVILVCVTAAGLVEVFCTPFLVKFAANYLL